MRKLLTMAIVAALLGAGAEPTSSLPAITPPAQAAASGSVGAYTLQFSAHPIDTRQPNFNPPAPFTLSTPPGPGLFLVQFDGPVEQSWLDALSARNIVPVHYVASNGYIVWADSAAQARLAQLRQTAAWLRYSNPFHGFLKVDPRLQGRLTANPVSSDEVDVTVQIYVHAGDWATRNFVASLGLVPPAQRAPVGSGTVDYTWAPILNFANVQVRVHVADIPAIANRPDVTFVGERLPRKMMDEKQDLIMTGDLAPGPDSIDYLQFLIDHGFSQNPDDYPIVDVTDSTIDEGGTGVTVLDTADPMLHVAGDLGQPVRVAYFMNCSSLPGNSVGAIDGHGSLNAGIVAGYDQRTGSPYQDSDGHQLGLGLNPFGRVGSTAIFVPDYDISGCGNSDQGVIQSNWQSGGRISSNSWGATFPPSTYDSSDQAYDVGVRDADPTESGNQEMIYIFAAANSGPGASTVSSPGAAKNVATVGASENLRPQWTDGCGVGPSGADDPMDVIDFSGRGPAPGNRVKPEVIGPGTHIQSGASIYSGYNGQAVCDMYHPAGQTVFAASSGTSHSTPETSGIASLAYWWIVNNGAGAAAGTVQEIGGNRAPSPAAMKAWLMAYPTYLTGVGANDDLPSNAQGYGMPNLTDMFSATPRMVLDQSDVFDNSGETRTYTWGVADPNQPVRITMVYTDAPGALGTNPQVNRLDLTVTANGQAYRGNHFSHQWSVTGGSDDTQNNASAVFLQPGVSGDLTITVTASNIAGDGIPGQGDGTDQDFALVCANCSLQPTFTLNAADAEVEVCAGDSGDSTLHIGQVDGFTDPVSLSASGNPAQTSTAFAPNPVTPPGDSTLTVAADAAAAAGTYPLVVTGTSSSITKTLDFNLDIYNTAPAEPALESPGDGAADQPLAPTFTWDAVDQAHRYIVQVATDPAFAHIVATTGTTQTAWTVDSGQALQSSMRYWWRVAAVNACSAGGTSVDTIFADGFDASVVVGAWTFSTLVLPGDCPIGVTPTVLFEDDMENGPNGWTHGAGPGDTDTWTLGSTAHDGSFAWQADAPPPPFGSQQWLVSPPVTLPVALSTLSLKFWNQQNLRSDGNDICYDGAILEISTDGGSTWTQVADSAMLTDSYDGEITGDYGNPLGGVQGWCGDPAAYLDSVVDLQAFAGQIVMLRFDLGNSDLFPHRDNPNWAIDDVSVTGCGTP